MRGLIRKWRRQGVPLWVWMGLRMSTLAIIAVVVIALAMWVYLKGKENSYIQKIPLDVRAQMEMLLQAPQENADLIWSLLREHYNIALFLPGLPGEEWWMVAAMVAIVTPFIIISALLVSRSISRQFTVLSAAVRKVRDGDFSIHLASAPRAPQELAELTDNFNDMGRRLAQYERELEESSVMLAHELRTPLNAAMGRLQAILDDVFPLEPDQLRKVHAQLEQINRLVGDLHLMSLARAGQLGLEIDHFSVRELLLERLEWATLRIAATGLVVHTRCDPALTLRADRDRVGQTVSILIENVLRYASDGGVLDITAYAEGDMACIVVADRGPGMDENHLSRAVDRFWRAEDSRSRHLGGSGLGLAIAAAICESHSGALACRNRSGGGLEIVLTLPA
ncbi:signal transduction histidine kinase [Janthinobacterium sp. 64]|nr:signal transduction histidine kinase [Janthinobacterium sp. 64]